jgi:protein phosphatase
VSAGPQSSPARAISWSGMTHVGRVRKNNEDAFLALAIQGSEVRYLGKFGTAPIDGADFVFAVSDGMGGAQSGEFASKIAVEQITRLLPRSFRAGAAGLSAGFEDILSEMFEQIHSRMNFMGATYEECRGMGATLSLCWITPGGVRFAHIGDSRIYLLPRDGGMTQISHDHTHVGWLRRTGQLTERQARIHPMRNVLSRALGAGQRFGEPQIGLIRWEPGDRLLLCSDGLTDGLTDERLEGEIRHSFHDQEIQASPIQQVIDASLENSGRDNTTALVITHQ